MLTTIDEEKIKLYQWQWIPTKAYDTLTDRPLVQQNIGRSILARSRGMGMSIVGNINQIVMVVMIYRLFGRKNEKNNRYND